jgi:hypothetical protein
LQAFSSRSWAAALTSPSHRFRRHAAEASIRPDSLVDTSANDCKTASRLRPGLGPAKPPKEETWNRVDGRDGGRRWRLRSLLR